MDGLPVPAKAEMSIIAVPADKGPPKSRPLSISRTVTSMVHLASGASPGQRSIAVVPRFSPTWTSS